MKDAARPPARRVALYGGSFNPPHLAHQMVVLAVLETTGVDALWLMPSVAHPFAKELAPFAWRRRWCEALLEPFGARASVCDFETTLTPPHYTIDTLLALSQTYPDTAFSLVLGSDIRAERTRWKAFDEIERRWPIHWIGRAGHAPSGDDPLVLPDISSTEIRRRLTLGEPIDTLVPRRVCDLLASEHPWKR